MQVAARRGVWGVPPASAVLAVITTTAADWRPDQLWRQVPRPVLGTVTVTVTPVGGSSGAGLRRNVTIAEGLGVAYSPVPRLTSERGLEPAEAVLTAPPGMTVSPQAGVHPGRVRHDRHDVRGWPDRRPAAGQATAPSDADRSGTWQRREAHRVAPPRTARHRRVRAAARRRAPSRPARSRLGSAARGDRAGTGRPGAPADQAGPLPLRRMLDTVDSHREVSLRITAGGRTAIIAHVGGTADRADPWLPAGTTHAP